MSEEFVIAKYELRNISTKKERKKRFEKKMRKVSNLIFVLLTFCLVLRIQISLAKPDGSPDACATVPGKKTVTY